MTNNDVLRRIRYIFDFDDAKMMALFALAGHAATRAEISDWLKKEDDPAYQNCSDAMLATFLNGLITDKRGKKEGPMPIPEKRLTNNMIFTKLRIALNLKADDILAMLSSANFEMSKHELSALFRKEGHKHFRECKDQSLRSFLKGMQLKYRKPEKSTASNTEKSVVSKTEKSAVSKPEESAVSDESTASVWSTKFKS